jgi:hypothetical protein
MHPELALGTQAQPATAAITTPIKDMDSVLHILDSTMMKAKNEIDWDELYSMIVGYELEDWS